MTRKSIVWTLVTVAILAGAWYADPFPPRPPEPDAELVTRDFMAEAREKWRFSEADALEMCRDTVRSRLSRPSAAWFDAWAGPEVTRFESDPPGTPTWDVHFYVDAVEPPYDIEVACRLRSFGRSRRARVLALQMYERGRIPRPAPPRQ